MTCYLNGLYLTIRYARFWEGFTISGHKYEALDDSGDWVCLRCGDPYKE